MASSAADVQCPTWRYGQRCDNANYLWNVGGIVLRVARIDALGRKTQKEMGNPGQDERDSGMIPNGVPG
jgi:hypothetical protein